MDVKAFVKAQGNLNRQPIGSKWIQWLRGICNYMVSLCVSSAVRMMLHGVNAEQRRQQRSCSVGSFTRVCCWTYWTERLLERFIGHNSWDPWEDVHRHWVWTLYTANWVGDDCFEPCWGVLINYEGWDDVIILLGWETWKQPFSKLKAPEDEILELWFEVWRSKHPCEGLRPNPITAAHKQIWICN